MNETSKIETKTKNKTKISQQSSGIHIVVGTHISANCTLSQLESLDFGAVTILSSCLRLCGEKFGFSHKAGLGLNPGSTTCQLFDCRQVT